MLFRSQSEWNLQNRFTGWTDVDLSDKGREEARLAGLKIADAALKPQFYFTSYLRRAIHTLQIAAAAMNRDWVPVVKDWHLNERHYGALQGLDKADTAGKYGETQVHLWRRSYDVEPPALTRDDARFPGNDERYSTLSDNELPLAESLKMTVDRVRPCWEEVIAPRLAVCDTVLIAAHGNSLRALAMMLLHISPDDIVNLEIPTGSPWLIATDDRLNVISNKYL